MRTKIFALLLFILFCCTSNKNFDLQNKSIGETQRDYQLLIKDVILKMVKNKEVSAIELQNIIPRTEDEFIEYYSYTNMDKTKEFRKAFYEVDSIIAERAENNHNNFLKLFLEIAPFADGEYAETYFDKVESVIQKNKVVFCKMFNSLNPKSKKRLEKYYKQYCN